MALVTKYGSFWGMIPFTTGRYFWVAPSASYTIEGQTCSASDSNDGLAPDRALLTFNAAIALATASVGDVIIGLQGAHSVSTPITVSKAGLTFVGIPGNTPRQNNRASSGSKRQKTSITSTQTAGIIFDVNAVDTEIAFFHLLPPAAGGRGISLRPLSGAANRSYIHDNTFAMVATASVTTFGITVAAGVTADLLEDVLVSQNYFLSGLSTSSGANGPGVNLLGTCHGFTIEHNTFQLKGTAAWAVGILSSQAGTLGLLVRDNDVVNPTSATTVMTTFLTTTGQTVDGSTLAYRNYVPAGTDFATASAIADICVAENFLGSVSSTGALANNN